MKREICFQYNIPADNNYLGLPDNFINVVAHKLNLLDGFSVLLHPVITSCADLRIIKNWDKALDEMETIARGHLGDISDILLPDVLMQENLS